MRLRHLFALLSLPFLAAAPCFAAERVTEVWRSAFGTPFSLSVNSADSSVWAVTGATVIHLSGTGALLGTTRGFHRPLSVTANSADGSCWVADSDQVVHLSSAGAVLWQGGSFSTSYGACAVSVNPTDGSCWVADYGGNQVVHLSASGAELWRGGSFGSPRSVSADSADGSCWVAYYSRRVVHLSAAGAVLWEGTGFGSPSSVSVNSTDGSCWVADFVMKGQVVHLSAGGAELWRGGSFGAPYSVSVNAGDGSCWVADPQNSCVVHLSAAGAELWRGNYGGPPISVNPTDGSCWVGSGPDIVRLWPGGSEAWRGGAFYWPQSVSVNSTDGSCWVADSYDKQVVHLSAAGAELWRGGSFGSPSCVSVDPTDGSCWVADEGQWDSASGRYLNPAVVHLSATGAELWRGGDCTAASSLAVNPTDGSCWACVGPDIVHLSTDGAELWRGGGSGWNSVAANPTDGSVWVTRWTGPPQVLHLSPVGDVIGQLSIVQPSAPSVDPVDGSCWVASAGAESTPPSVVHVTADGTVLWRGAYQGPVSVNPRDGSCWVLDYSYSVVVHLSASGVELWRGSGFRQPAAFSVNPTDSSCWVADTCDGQVVHLAVHGVFLSVSASPPDVPSGGTTELVATAFDSYGHSVVSWSWSDGGAGGTFSPSAEVPDPAYVAPTYADYVDHPIALSVTATCDGADPVSETATTILTVLAPPLYAYTSCAAFEEDRAPLATFASGQAQLWRIPLAELPSAHSGLYVAAAEVAGEGLAGLRLELPIEPTPPAQVELRAWVYVADRTVGDASSFFGFSFSTQYPDAATGWQGTLGWEVLSDTSSRCQLAGASVPEGYGFPSGAWRLLQVRYVPALSRVTAWLDGVQVAEADASLAAGRAPRWALLGALGQGPTAVQHVYWDDVQVSFSGFEPTQDRVFARLLGPEQVAQGQTRRYTLTYGNGYPALGTDPATGTVAQEVHLAAALPAGYTLASADPAPSRTVGGTPVWDLPLPERQQEGLVQLEVLLPDGLSEPRLDRLWCWATSDPAAATADPPLAPTGVVVADLLWGAPQDVLFQQVALAPEPDVWIRTEGPRCASPGDTLYYALTVGNSGQAPAEDLVVKDQLPELLGGGDRIIANLASLAPGETWSGVVSGALPWGVPEGTVLTNRGTVSVAAGEVVTANNASDWSTTTQAAQDPNELAVSPTGGTDRGDLLSYTLSCENVGAGTAYGVYATAPLDRQLDASTLSLGDPETMEYDPISRTLVWEVGTLAPGESASTTFTAAVSATAKRARPVVGRATVYFPSVPEETPTNVVANIVASTFTDVPWNSLSIRQIELAYEHGIVKGYGDGGYRPTAQVNRGQMAAYIARTAAGGDELVPTGPSTATFSDVDASFWAYHYIEYCVSLGIVRGYGDGTYHPEYAVTRGQMAGYVARALAGGEDGVPAGPAASSFSDVGLDLPFFRHIEYIVSRGVVTGYADGTYRPEVVVTRELMALYVARAFALSE